MNSPSINPQCSEISNKGLATTNHRMKTGKLVLKANNVLNSPAGNQQCIEVTEKSIAKTNHIMNKSGMCD